MTRHELPELEDLSLAGDPWLTWGSNGLVYLSCLPMLTDDDGDQFLQVWVYHSTDGGQHWLGPTRVPLDEGHWPDHPVIVAGKGNESETALSVFATNGRSGIGIWESSGAGEAFSFSSEHVPDTLNNNAVNLDGVVGVRWTALHEQPETAPYRMCSDIYFTASLDGGASFLPNKRISSVTSCCDTRQTERRMCWGGEYSGMAAGVEGAFHLIWTDNRTGVLQNWVATAVVREK